MTIYSARFLQGLVPAGSQATFVVPDDQVAVVRDAVLAAWSGNPIVLLTAQNAVTPAWSAYMRVAQLSTSGQVTDQWQGRQVLYPGDRLNAQAVNGAATVLVSGYLLTRGP